MLKGNVVSATTGQPLAGATIQLVGTSKGTMTDESGYFQIPAAIEKIIVSYIGYTNREILVRELDTLLIQLAESIQLIDGCVITAPFLPNQFHYPVSLKTLKLPDLSRDIDLSLAPALNRIPGVFMQSGTFGTNRLSVRGIGSRTPFGTSKIRVFLQAIPLTNGAGESTFEDVDINLLGNVTIYKGPSSSDYGAALGGMLHLKAKQIHPDDSGISTVWQAGAYGLRRNATAYEQGFEQGWVFGQYTRTHSDGYRENSRYDRESASIVTHFEPDRRNGFTFLADYVSVNAQIPSSINRTDYLNNPRRAASNWAAVHGYEDYVRVLAGLSHRLVLLDKNNHKLTLINAAFTTWRQNDESRPFNILAEESNIVGTRSRLDWENNTGEWKMESSIGAEFFSENYAWQTYATDLGIRGDNISDNRERRSFHNYFAQFRLERSMFHSLLFMEAGANYNSTEYRFQDLFNFDSIDHSGLQPFDAIVSPRISAGCFFNDKITIYATASHGFSSPTLEETLTPEGFVNPDIQHEQGWNFELGSRGFNIGAWRWAYEMSVYTMHIRDLLVAERIGEDQYIGANAGKTIHNGFEISISAKPFPLDALVTLDIFASYSYADYHFDTFVDNGIDYTGNPLTGVPPHTASVGANIESLLGIYGNINWQFSDKLSLRDDASVFSEPYDVVNIKAGWRYLAVKRRWEFNVFCGLNNVLDEKYASMVQINAVAFGAAEPRYYYPGLPRNAYFGAGLKFKLGQS